MHNIAFLLFCVFVCFPIHVFLALWFLRSPSLFLFVLKFCQICLWPATGDQSLSFWQPIASRFMQIFSMDWPIIHRKWMTRKEKYFPWWNIFLGAMFAGHSANFAIVFANCCWVVFGCRFKSSVNEKIFYKYAFFNPNPFISPSSNATAQKNKCTTISENEPTIVRSAHSSAVLFLTHGHLIYLHCKQWRSPWAHQPSANANVHVNDRWWCRNCCEEGIWWCHWPECQCGRQRFCAAR